jgi:GNAT superfamily N-acetyltransferase
MANLEFVALDELNAQVVADFIPLLGRLSSTFRKRDEEENRVIIEATLTAALSEPADRLTAPDMTAILVARDPETKHIVSTLTGNVIAGTEGWVDDVVTLEAYGGRGFGRRGMDTVHKLFQNGGVKNVLLTSKQDRGAAGDLYAKLGYVEGGVVMRAALTAENATHPAEASREFFIGQNCLIPTGNKAWVYAPQTVGDSTPLDVSNDLMAANANLYNAGVTAANFYSTGEVDPKIKAVLEGLGYAERETRLYELDLSSVS